MTSLKQLPIFCDRCPTLAFAVLDNQILCEKCLFEQLAAAENSPLEIPNIEPLQFAEPPRNQVESAPWV